MTRVPATFVIGALYGDEGKGRVVDALVAAAPNKRELVVVRVSGGGNARHTVVRKGRPLHVRQVPVGLFHRGVTSLIGPGSLVAPLTLVEELDALERAHVDTSRVRISSTATVVLPLHAADDERVEERRKRAGLGPIGTTRSGIGPALVDKMRRIALRVDEIGD